MLLRKHVERALFLIGACLLTYWSASSIDTKSFQQNASREFSKTLEAATPEPAAPQQWTEGSAVARLEIPRLGMSTMVVEGAGHRDLKRAAGHIPGTAFPGTGGNTGIAAHRDTFFHPLRFIRIADSISVTTPQGTFAYRVVSTQIVKPDQIQVLYPTQAESLTLVTCYPFNFVGPAPWRFIVRAERVQ